MSFVALLREKQLERSDILPVSAEKKRAIFPQSSPRDCGGKTEKKKKKTTRKSIRKTVIYPDKFYQTNFFVAALGFSSCLKSVFQFLIGLPSTSFITWMVVDANVKYESYS